MAARIGFDFDCGDLMLPRIVFVPRWVRMIHESQLVTIRVRLMKRFFGILHETGHGLYDQGLRADWYGLGPGQYLSLGIHESQSRMWENLVGRSHAFWEFAWPLAQQAFPTTLSDVSRETFYRAINRVEPSFIFASKPMKQHTICISRFVLNWNKRYYMAS